MDTTAQPNNITIPDNTKTEKQWLLLTINELRAKCNEHGCNTLGKKKDLAQRLVTKLRAPDPVNDNAPIPADNPWIRKSSRVTPTNNNSETGTSTSDYVPPENPAVNNLALELELLKRELNSKNSSNKRARKGPADS